jgi:hypothetical protein
MRVFVVAMEFPFDGRWGSDTDTVVSA